jgi:hypothetical protein
LSERRTASIIFRVIARSERMRSVASVRTWTSAESRRATICSRAVRCGLRGGGLGLAILTQRLNRRGGQTQTCEHESGPEHVGLAHRCLLRSATILAAGMYSGLIADE